MIRVAVFGAAGRVGSTVCRAVVRDAELDLVAGVDPNGAGSEVAGITITADRSAIVDAGAEVVVDFTHIKAARDNVIWAAEQGLHAVVGTTGWSPDELDQLAVAFEKARKGCIVAPNFAIGAVLMMRFAELAAPWFDTAEVVELHHDAKRDAPSGTAMLTVDRMIAASPDWEPDPTEQEVVRGARGGERGGIHIHSLRLRGMVAHQEVILGTTGQTLTIRHDSYDRESFMPGVLAAIKRIAEKPGLTVGLDVLLGI